MRWDEVGSPDAPAPEARLDADPPPDAAPAAVADLGVTGSGPAAPVAVLGDDGSGPPPAPVADLAEPRAAPPPLLIVQLESGPATPRNRTDDQQGRRSGRLPATSPTEPAPDAVASDAAASDAAASATPRPRRSFGPKQIDPDADPVAAAREICLRLLTDRARTRQELAQALGRRGVPDEVAGSVLARFDEVGLIDDAAFAAQFVRSRHRHKGLARRAIARELQRKGVDGEIAEEALDEVDADSESRRARELVDRKLRSFTVTTPEQRVVAARRLVGMLARKGYGAGIAYGVVREALAAHGADPDELAEDIPED